MVSRSASPPPAQRPSWMMWTSSGRTPCDHELAAVSQKTCAVPSRRSVECRCGSVDSRCIGPFLGQPVSEPALIIPGQATPGRADVGVDARTARASSGPAENVQHPITGAASFVEPAGVAADIVVRRVFPIDGYVDSGTDLLVKFCSFEPLVRQGSARY